MKRSETPTELLGKRREYIADRWKQLSELELSWGEEAVKYLLLVNTGAMAATLGFIGAMPHIRQAPWPRIVLCCFVLGVVLIGLFHAFRFHNIRRLFIDWRTDVKKYNSDDIEWNDLLDRDAARLDRGKFKRGCLIYASFISFLLGIIIAGSNFGDITKPPPKEITSERTQTYSADGSTGTSPRATSSSARPREKDSSSANSGTGQRPNATTAPEK